MNESSGWEKAALHLQNALIAGALGFVGWAMAGCALDQGAQSRVRVELPERLTLDPLMWLDRGVVVPSQFRCFGLNVSGPGMPQMPGMKDSCTAADAGRPRLGLVYGSVTETQGFDLLVPAGPARVFQLIGMEGVEGQPCPKVEDLIRGQVNGGDAYKPYELAVATVDVFGDTAVTLRIDESRVENQVCFTGGGGGAGGNTQFVFTSNIGGPQPPLPPGHWKFPTFGAAAEDCYPLRLREQSLGGQGVAQGGPLTVMLESPVFAAAHVLFHAVPGCTDTGVSQRSLSFVAGEVDSGTVYVRSNAAQHSLIGLSTTATGRNLPPGLLLSFGAGSASGSLVLSYGTNGRREFEVTPEAGMQDTPYRLWRHPDGKVYAVGTGGSLSANFGRYTIARFDPGAGAFDPNFGAGGRAAIGATDSVPMMMAAQFVPLPQMPGKVLVIGGCKTGCAEVYLWSWRRNLEDGTADPDYPVANSGTQVLLPIQPTQLGANSDVSAVDLVQTVVEPGSGRIWVVGGYDYTEGLGYRRGFVLRFLPDGTVDTSFGSNGFLRSAFAMSREEFLDAVVVGSELVIVGASGTNANPQATVWKIPFSATVMPTPIVIGGTNSRFFTLRATPDGKLWLAGAQEGGFARDELLVARVRADLSPDPLFNGGVPQQWDLGNSAYAYSVRRLIPAPGGGVVALVRSTELATSLRVVTVSEAGAVALAPTIANIDRDAPVDVLVEDGAYRFLVVGRSTLNYPGRLGFWKLWF